MRITYNNQLSFGSVEISEIKFDPKSRNEIDKALLGLQCIFVNIETSKEVFQLLRQILPEEVSRSTGRPGMDMWKILVLGVMRLTCNWDYDTLHNMTNNHTGMREMLGHGKTDWSDKKYYELQTIKDNISLLPDNLLDQINEIVVKAGHNLLSGKKKENLQGSADSFVVETDVHYPTDINLLFDSMRKAISISANLCNKLNINGFRQWQHNIKSIKKLLRIIQKVKKSRSKTKDIKLIETHKDYLKMVNPFIQKINIIIEHLRSEQKLDWLSELQCQDIYKYLEYAEKHIDLIERRVINNEIIPHSEKIFSIFEPHTRWISKGKVGVPVEFGLPVTIIKDQFGFILKHEVMETTSDVDVAVPLTKRTKETFDALNSCSFDKGYYSPSNREELSKILDQVVMPKKGRLNFEDRQIQNSKDFKELRKKHSAVESAINGLEHSGLDKCPDHGIDGFKRYVSLSILARNLQTLGKLIQEKELKKKKRKKRRLSA